MRVTESMDELVEQLDNYTQTERVIAAANEDLDAFLSDPIGFGDYDHTDPISLEEYRSGSAMHGRYAHRLT